jgi:tRNA modification GTPase
MREGLGKVIPTDDTIVAIATPQGRSGIGVVRLSGNLSQSIAQRFLNRPTAMTHRQASVGLWTDSTGTVIDEVVATLFKAPHSYTGEDVLEISAHGNPRILRNIVEAVRGAGARLAAPGEFTLRAVIHGKMDLIQAEAVRNFIDAQTDMQARTARLQMSGSLSKQILPVREKLVDIIAHLEAGIDFADDDVRPPEDSILLCLIDPMLDELQKLQESYSFGRLLAAGLRVAIIGKPNVGKSSLFNRLVGADRAIVTSIPGTTRDVLSENISLDGVPLQFLDTAGMRNTADPIEAIGVAKAEEALAEADLVLVVIDGASGLDDSDRNILSRIVNSKHLIIVNKCDLPQAVHEDSIRESTLIRISAKTGEGIGDLERAIQGFAGNPGGEIPGSILTSARHFESICGASRALGKCRSAMAQGTPHEMVLLDLYEALSELNELTGEVVTEDILGRIFSTFCLGK